MTSSGKNPYAKKPENPEKPEAPATPATKSGDDSAPLIAVPMGDAADGRKPGDKKKQAAPAAWPGLEQAAAEGKTAVEKAPRIPTPEEKAAAEKAAAQKSAAKTEVKAAKPAAGAKPGEEANNPALVQVPHSSTEPDEGWTAAAVERNPLAGWSLGLGIASVVALLLLLIFVVPPLLVSLAGIIVGVLAVRKAKKNTTEGRRMGVSVAGLVMSVVVFIISVVFGIVMLVLFQRYSPDIVACGNQYPEGSDERDQCVAEVIDRAISGGN
ncbi:MULTISPECIES: DUF4190 domain-containing protein [unclassified Corynebacterium]|uniref:DUF4190 domain-containing protein n=1 Tax=unclassified Corynebacterium TaxID=2624378 RepID=UPI0029CA4FE0|nr:MULTISPECIES: DUF4190 domain-containing protein [unclassified Corynebacterium]WPF65233.1 DUF4190 domain-containing protein [Corynebacterium sp. 22KM0430]WPF67728.1 DUF4190 domain-containing protein [Corynebacterium sp. 21KM1197]